jgi:hypothetical protein
VETKQPVVQDRTVESLLAGAALAFGEEHHDVADLVLVGLCTGDWQALGDAVTRGLALEAERATDLSADELDRKLKAFRYERGLIAGAELRTWLSERALSLHDLQGVLRRRLLSKRFEGVSCASSSGVAEVVAVIRAEAICTGTLASCARELCAWHAGGEAIEDLAITPFSLDTATPESACGEELVATALADPTSILPTLGLDELRKRTARLVALRTGYERFRDAAVSESAVARRLEERRMDWTVVAGSELDFELEGAARETCLRVAHDGQTLAEVADMLGLDPTPRELELGRVHAQLGAELLVAREGALVGPWSEGERWRVLQLERRLEPEPSNPTARERAREQLLSELIERFSAGKARQLAAL